MTVNTPKRCPRCNSSFNCKTDTVQNCQCKAVLLTPEQLEYIARHYDDCLCARCLASLAQDMDQTEPDPAIIDIV